jgi:predicted ribosome quality control (RQC) complex YloA/Tae2 family protein
MKEGHWEKYRHFCTSTGRLVIGGKNAEQNEELVARFIGKQNTIMHTKEAGSPFCVITGKPAKPEKTDLKETAIFCAMHSREWKRNRHDVEVHAFTGKDVYKEKSMKTGTFAVRKIRMKITITTKDIEDFNKKPKK